MTKDVFTILQVKTLIKKERIVLNKVEYNTDEFNTIREAVLKNIPLPIIYAEQDKFGIIHLKDKLSTIFIDLLERDFDELSPKEQSIIEDYQFQISMTTPVKNDIENKIIVEKLKNILTIFY